MSRPVAGVGGHDHMPRLEPAGRRLHFDSVRTRYRAQAAHDRRLRDVRPAPLGRHRQPAEQPARVNDGAARIPPAAQEMAGDPHLQQILASGVIQDV